MLRKYKVTLMSGAVETVEAHEAFWKRDRICFVRNGSERNEWTDEVVAMYNPKSVLSVILM